MGQDFFPIRLFTPGQVIHVFGKDFFGNHRAQQGLQGGHTQGLPRVRQQGVETAQPQGGQVRLGDKFPKIGFFVGRKKNRGLGKQVGAFQELALA